jgi:hypothetical protein
MALTVNSAFGEFMEDQVNLDGDESELARSSRDWLVGQIAALPNRTIDFPTLYHDIDIHFGSFARKTKIRELDDLDMVIGLNAMGTTYETVGSQVRLSVPTGSVLSDLCHPGSIALNSRRVINRFVTGLSSIPQYEKADISRSGSAAVLKLKSYPWSFDIVPGFLTTPELDGRTYYVIPDGKGHWMKTDPRIDRDRVTRVNQAHDGRVLAPLRLAKFWNRRPTMPSMPSYLLENLVLSYYEGPVSASSFVDVELMRLLESIASGVFRSVQDPKGIQGDLNTLELNERFLIAMRALEDVAKAKEARRLEVKENYGSSISMWREILGPSFPLFG